MAKDKTVKAKQGTVIKPCSCVHKGQDELHGATRRVHNLSPKGVAVCTVCGAKK